MTVARFHSTCPAARAGCRGGRLKRPHPPLRPRLNAERSHSLDLCSIVFKLVVGYVLFLALVALAGWGFVEAVQADPAVVGSIGVAVAGALGVAWQQRQAEKARLREARRDRIRPIYYDLLGVVFRKLGEGKSDTSDAGAEEFFRDLKARQLTLGASSEMVQAFNGWAHATEEAQKEKNDLEAVLAWEVLLRAIRRDLGHEDSDLPPLELLRLFITDFDDHFSPEK